MVKSRQTPALLKPQSLIGRIRPSAGGLEALQDVSNPRRRPINDFIESLTEASRSNEELTLAIQQLQSANAELTAKIAEIRDANSDLDNFIRSTQIAAIFLDNELNLRIFTPEAQKIFGFGISDHGRRFDEIDADIDIQALTDDCRRVARSGTSLEAEYTCFHDTLIYHGRITPDHNDGTATGGIVLTLVDITPLRSPTKKADRQTTLPHLGLTEFEEFNALSPLAMALVGPDLTFVRMNQQLAEIYGITVKNGIGRKVADAVPNLKNQMLKPIKRVLETGERIENVRVNGATAQEPDDQRVWETDWYPVCYGDGIQGVGINVRDITEHVQVSIDLRHVMQELQHRVKNMLANILALVSRAGREATVDKAVYAALSKRIFALSQTHILLTRSNQSTASVTEVFETELLDIYGKDRVNLTGPEIPVNARAALSLGMAVHELATNAAKFGSFSVSEGRVNLSWVRQDDGAAETFIFTWTEIGGPAPDLRPKDGFGSQLIHSTIEGSLSGEVRFDWKPSGLTCVLSIPARILIKMSDDTVFDTLTA